MQDPINPVDMSMMKESTYIRDEIKKYIGSREKNQDFMLKFYCRHQKSKPILRSPIMFIFSGDKYLSTKNQHVRLAENLCWNENKVRIDIDVTYDHAKNSTSKTENNSFQFTDLSSTEEITEAIEKGREIVKKRLTEVPECNTVGFGETSEIESASAKEILQKLHDLKLQKCKETKNGNPCDGSCSIISQHTILKQYGKKIIAKMAGAMYEAVRCGLLIVVCGSSAKLAHMLLSSIHPFFSDYALLCENWLQNSIAHSKWSSDLSSHPYFGQQLEKTHWTFNYLFLQCVKASFEKLGNTEKENDYESQDKSPYTTIRLPTNVSRHGHLPDDCLAVVLDSILTQEECNTLITRGTPHFKDVKDALGRYQPDRNSATAYELAVLQDKDFANVIWSRLSKHVDTAVAAFSKRDACGVALGLCQRLRILRYSGQDRFEPHYDRVVPDEETGCHSLITVLVYLNDGGGVEFSGGETLFLNALNPTEGAMPIIPRTGRVVLFEHGLFHSGAPLLSIRGGSKFVMRTDVMFKTSDCVIKPLEVMECTGKRKVGGGDIETVTDLLEVLQMGHFASCLEDFGLLGSIEVFCLPGIVALNEMLADAGLSHSERQVLIAAAFEHA